MSAPTARLIEADELYDWYQVPRTAMLGSPVTPEEVESVRGFIYPERCMAAYDGTAGGRPVGSAGSFPAELTVPGGSVATGAVTAVGVLPTHRRQGHLTRVMEAQLADIVERDEPVAALVAAEYPIYGRFGYGPAIEACAIRLDADPRLWRDAPTGTTELVDNEVYTKELIELYQRVRHSHPGHLEYDDARWQVHTGKAAWPGGNTEERLKATRVLWRDDAGEVGAAVSYTVNSKWTDNRPQGTADVSMLVAASPEAEREAMRYLTSVDWTTSVHLGTRPIDHPASLWLHDGRAAVLEDRSDHVWVRILDVPAALGARRYAVDGRLVLEIDDPMGFAGGRFALEGGPDGALCSATTDDPDLVLPARTLGAAYLGGSGWAQLAAGGWLTEARAGAVERASMMFSTPRAPWCAMSF